VYLRSNGFPVKAEDKDDLAAIKRQYSVPNSLAACHTAVVDGYVIEGHVPADLIDRLLRERPRIAGIAVPGMPAGSPGMTTAPGQPAERYQVLTFDERGLTTVFANR
jgi:hypothetical protein